MKRLPGIFLPLIFLAGCAAGPDYVRRDPDVPSAWLHANRTVDSARTADLTYWWRQLNDPLLAELVEEALNNSPDMRSARARLLESRARTDLADAGLFPSLKASLSKNRSKTGSGATTDLYSAGFDASWELDLFGGQRRAAEAADADAGAALANLHDTQVSLSAEVALNYVQLRSYQARLQIARDNLAAQGETLQITEWREQAGLVTTLEVEQARSNLSQTRAAIPALNTGLTKAENRLALLLGKFPAALHDRLSAPADLPALPDAIALGIPADTLRQRPDVRAAERKVAAETARIGQATAALYPSFSLNGSLGWKAFSFGALGGSDTLARSVSAGIAQTLFDGGSTGSRVRAQNAVQQQALIAWEKTVLGALEDVENSLAAYANSRERKSALQAAAASARNAAQIARQRYESGIIDYQSVLDTERSLLSSEDGLASAGMDELAALIGLYKALGGGWRDDAATTSDPEISQGGKP
ncbi:MAG: efflux transporter outer membrane subunit [Gallionellaceae bacterium]|nr:efflux transporter outer membrane subunit [Gallionellaceae bacterium]